MLTCVCLFIAKHTVQTIKCIRLEGNAQISALWGHERCCFHPQVWISHAYAPNLEQFVWSVTCGFMCKAHTSVMRTRTKWRHALNIAPLAPRATATQYCQKAPPCVVSHAHALSADQYRIRYHPFWLKMR